MKNSWRFSLKVVSKISWFLSRIILTSHFTLQGRNGEERKGTEDRDEERVGEGTGK